MREIDEDLADRDGKINDLQDAIKGKDGELQDLEDLIMHKDRIIDQLQMELANAEDQRRKDIEERKKP